MSRIGLACFFLLVVVASGPLLAQTPGMTPEAFRSAVTVHSIGLEWDLSGDTDRDAQGTVQYRAVGSSTWKPALPLVRVQFAGKNMLAGSILFLDPGTSYEVQVAISDPDGGSGSRTETLTTRTEPTPPSGGTTRHVGNGQAYSTISDAWSAAAPGDTILVHAGSYGTVSGTGKPSGAPGNHIVIKSAGDGEAVIEWIDLRYVSYLWFEGLTFRSTDAPMPQGAADADDFTAIFASLLRPGYDNGYVSMSSQVNGIVIKRCTFVGYKHAIRAGPATNGWFVTDNSITGNRVLDDTTTGRLDGEGVELGDGSDHIVAYNRITRTADAISSPNRNCDIYGNDIFLITDDGIELDDGKANTRAFLNRIHSPGNNGFSFQPQGGAPWYIVRNQVAVYRESALKFRDYTDRFLALHNTFVNWNEVLDHWSDYLLSGITKNNLWISVNNGPIWERGYSAVDWRTDLDYDGFDWGTNAFPFNYGGQGYSDLPSLNKATGQESHGIRIDRSSCFETFNVPGPWPMLVPPQHMTLRANCSAVDAGVVLPNINDGYSGSAPDLGAFEVGQTLPEYGPRAAPPPGEESPPPPPTGLRVD